jgi:hypothetical protein
MTDTIEKPEYIDRSTAMNMAARIAAKEVLEKEFQGFRSEVFLVKTRTIAAVNRAYRMGDTIQEFTGHKKLALAEYGQFALAIGDAPIAFAKECISIRQNNDEPIKTYEQAAPIFKKLMEQFELLPKGSHGEQTKHPHEPVMEYLKTLVTADAESVELLEEFPMEKWARFNVVTFFNNSKRIHDLHELAGSLIKEKGEL